MENIKDRAEFVTAELSAGALNDPEQTLGLITEIPFRDFTLRFAFDNSELRPNMLERLGDLLEIASTDWDKATLHAIRAGIAWLDADRDSTLKSIDLALSFDATYSLARLLDVALRHEVPATVWADSLRDVTPEQCLAGAN